MSTVYITEPPTRGKVLLHTSAGDVDVELWSKEAPLACRNFCQLCMEGYYDGLVFHRVIRNFMVQGGDPTGTGEGGESIYGKPFKDEFHQRIRFNHRGQVAMANPNVPNSNQSQFFITLGECDWLDRKHTIFGKVTGNTIFNVLKMGDADTDANDRPLFPPRILGAEVLMCPFDDISPRTSRKEREEAERRKAEAEASKARAAKKKLAKKNFSLISFGEEAGEDEVSISAAAAAFKGAKSSHDVLEDASLSAVPTKIAATAVGAVSARAARKPLPPKSSGAERSSSHHAAVGSRGASDATSRESDDDLDRTDKTKQHSGVTEKAQLSEEAVAKQKRKARAQEYLRLKEEMLRNKRAKQAGKDVPPFVIVSASF